MLKRSRDGSPMDRRDASPPLKRERLASPAPRGRYARRSPPPRERYEENNYRPARSRTPPRRDERDYSRRSPSTRLSNPQSGATSRRSSPPVHPSRLRQVEDRSYNSPRVQAEPLSNAPSPHENSYHAPANGAPPRGPANRGRAPPTGPAAVQRSFTSPAMSPPVGPAGATPPISAHTRAHAVPSASRGGFGGSFRGRGRGFGRGAYDGGGFGRGGGGGYQGNNFHGENEFNAAPVRRTSEVYHNPATRATLQSSNSTGVPNAPSGPRGGTTSQQSPTIPTGPSAGNFRGGPPPSGPSSHNNNNNNNANANNNMINVNANTHGNGTSSTYPRSQRFLADLPTLVPGGRKMNASMPVNTKVKRLEEEAEKLRRVIEEKEKASRVGLREWERLESETEVARLRTELAEEGLRIVERSGL
ncbi:hypothetical protein EJ08DRAFT_363413 [Tothia fuscella]|uniref:Uncharacterized protein n=1 Tax=Tothia fuscella TaxID=1048955 RepID=A0A9P4NM97_9PEZI|nr:hypothetical protein EJ08DRAFT_363413 [Tothia fuscella]